MPAQQKSLDQVQTFPQLVAWLRDELGWPLESDNYEDISWEYDPEELGLKKNEAAKIDYIRQLRPMSDKQPFGIFFVKFNKGKLPVVALRRILSNLVVKRRASANKADRPAWEKNDLLFLSSWGDAELRQMNFAHFADNDSRKDLPTLKVLDWGQHNTKLHVRDVEKQLHENLVWPEDTSNSESWRRTWRGAFYLRHRETIDTSKGLSIRLAELARAIRDHISEALAIETEKGPLTTLLKAFRQGLMHDLDEDGFADMYAQTIAYGLLSARIADPKKKTTDDFAAHMRTSPFLRELMGTFLAVGGRKGSGGGPGIDFDELGVSGVVELLDEANMEAVLRDFGDKSRREDPVIHFYELFLHQYDKQLKIQRGVFYTPQPVVSYIVHSVHELLQSEFGLTDGLADTTTWREMLKKNKNLKLPPLTDEPGEKRNISPDEPFVQILDPATGTATFLVEVIDVIYRTMTEKWGAEGVGKKRVEALWNDYVPRHLLPRLHAYELMMAPYAIAHMKLGLKLAETGYRFETEQRARIYLTNALEPWQKQFKLLAFDALGQEAAAVNEIKRHKRFTVVVGNPPYSLVSANMGPSQRMLVARYKFCAGERLRERGALQLEKILNDDYVKFIAKSQDLLITAGTGLLGLITNHAYLDNPTMRGLRYSFIESFEKGYFFDLGGSAKKAGENIDENVFDILQGVATCVVVKNGHGPEPKYCHARIVGTREAKYKSLREITAKDITWTALSPSRPYYLFIPTDYQLRSEYEQFLPLSEIFPLHSIGCFTSKDHFVISRDVPDLIANAKAFRDSTLTDKQLCKSFKINPKAAWNVGRSREQIRQLSDTEIRRHVVSFMHRPFDHKNIFYHRSLVWSLAYPVNRNLIERGNLALVTSRQLAAPPWRHVFCSNTIVEMFLMSNKTKEGNHVFPLYALPDNESGQRGLDDNTRRPNFFGSFLDRLSGKLRLSQNEMRMPKGIEPEDILYYAYAVLHSCNYRSRYAEFLKIDFPRLPLTENLELFRALAKLGCELTTLHLLESPRHMRPITKFFGKNSGVTRVGWSADDGGTVWVDAQGTAKNFQRGTSGFRPVPKEVWTFRIGGYQVCEKWLKDRGPKKGQPGRTLSKDDITHYHKIVIALTETIRIMAEIDDVIERHGGWPDAFATETDALRKAAEPAADYSS